jgi:hypothetical protein
MTCLKPESAQPSGSSPDGGDFNPFAAMEPRVPEATPAPARNGARVKANGVAPQGVYLTSSYRPLRP